jgi:hypothetical protein
MSELRIAVTAYALLTAMLLAGFIGWRDRLGVIILALLSIVWLSADQNFEGPTLIKFSQYHGLVLADLVGIAGLGISVWLWLARR